METVNFLIKIDVRGCCDIISKSLGDEHMKIYWSEHFQTYFFYFDGAVRDYSVSFDAWLISEAANYLCLEEVCDI